jgi:Ser/Thr protein kinase RdoA (MazF antagonist)
MAPTGGVSNINQYITTADGEQKMLRIYNGFDTDRIKVEHDILEKLNEEFGAESQRSRGKLSFKIPNFIKSKSGVTFEQLSNGGSACMCDALNGGASPNMTCMEAVGSASGELVSALGKLAKMDATGLVSPAYDMWAVHPAVTKDNFEETMKSDAFEGELREYADEMLAEALELSTKCASDYKKLPLQLIHSDMHYDSDSIRVNMKKGKNFGQVSAIMDFEYAAYDWRAMELAIGLSKYVGEEKSLNYVADYMTGYAKKASLTKPEADALPDLINLRVLSNVVYFVGRAISKEDDISTLKSKLEDYTKRVRWVKANADKIKRFAKIRWGLLRRRENVR